MTIFLKKSLGFEVSELKSTKEGTFQGYASKFNGTDSYGDTILPGAYADVVASANKLPIFLNHNTQDVPLGFYSLVKEDEKGLYVEGELTLSIQKARDVYEALKAGSLNGLSVGIWLSHNDYKLKDVDDPWSGRTIEHVSGLREISVCTYPADDSARISAIKSSAEVRTVRDLENLLRDAGFSKNDALDFISKSKTIFFDEQNRRDSETEIGKLNAGIQKLSQSFKK